MATESERLETVAANLLSESDAGRIRWEEGPGFSFIAPFNTATVVVRSVDRDGDAPYELQIVNPAGAVLASRKSETSPFGGFAGTPWNNALSLLYRSARRTALDVDQVLDSLLGDVGEARQPPPEDDDIPF